MKWKPAAVIIALIAGREIVVFLIRMAFDKAESEWARRKVRETLNTIRRDFGSGDNSDRPRDQKGRFAKSETEGGDA